MRIADVATRAGVSPMTVSNVLNAPHRVSEQTTASVLAAIDELDYTPNHAARALSSGRSRVIGLVMDPESEPTQENPGLGGTHPGFLLRTISEAARVGYGVHLVGGTTQAEIELYEQLITSRTVDAIVVLGTMPEDPRIDFLARREFPFVAFGRTGPNHRQSWIDVDNKRSMAAVVRHVIDAGHRRLAYLQDSDNHPWVGQRRAGFDEELARAGLTPHSISTVRRITQVTDIVDNLVNTADRPDAIVADTDSAGAVAIQTLRRNGLVAGTDIAVTGFDDHPIVSLLDIPLTTARVPLADIAARVVTRALHEIARGPDQPGELVTAELVVRASG